MDQSSQWHEELDDEEWPLCFPSSSYTWKAADAKASSNEETHYLDYFPEDDYSFEGYPEPLNRTQYTIPPILQYSGYNPYTYSTHIESCISSAASLISTYDRSILHLKDQLRMLEADRTHLMKYRNDYKCIKNSPIRRIPEEVLSLIFTFVVSNEDAHLVNAAGSILHHRLPNALLIRVCRHWRHVALHTPVLWSCINLELQNVNWWEAPKLTNAVRLFKRYLELSRTVGLNLVVHFPIDGIGSGGSKTQVFVDLLCEQAERWKDVWLESVTRDDIVERLERKVKGRLGMLEKLRVFVQKDARRLGPVTLDLGTCDKLRRLEWKGLSVAFPDEYDEQGQERMERLESIQLECNASRGRTCDLPGMFHGVLHRAPLLQSLRVKCQHQHSIHADTDLEHLSSNITTFEMINTSAPLLDMLTLPHLASLGIRTTAPTPLGRFLARSGCSITHLSLATYLDIDNDELLRDSVQSLHLSSSPAVSDLLDADDIFPNLHQLAITDITPKELDVNRLMEVVERRHDLKLVVLPPTFCARSAKVYRSPGGTGSSLVPMMWVQEMKERGCTVVFDTPDFGL